MALLPILGVVVGASLQYWFSKMSKAREYQQNLKTEAYVDFLHSIAGKSITQKNKDLNKEQEFSILLTDAKARIVIYGSKEVIESIATLWRGGVNLDTPDRKQSFINICQVMRRDSSPRYQSVLDEEIYQLIFK